MTVDDPPVLITGATGLLGAALVRAATADGLRTVATWHRTRPSGPAGADQRLLAWEQLELASDEQVRGLLRRVRPTTVVHTAYVEGGPGLWEVTARAPGQLAAACAEAGARMVHVSTDVVLGGRCGITYGDGAVVDPRHDYGRAKAEAERLVAAAAPGALIARTSLLLGGPSTPGRQERLVADNVAGRVATTFFDDEMRCPLRVDDLAAALLALAETEVAGTLNVAGADLVSRAELARRIATSLGLDASLLRCGPTPAELADRPRCIELDSRVAAAVHPLRGVREILPESRPPAG